MSNQYRRTRAEERIAELDTSSAGFAKQIDDLQQQLAAAKSEAERATQEAAERKASWQRMAADFANYRRRTEQDREQTLGLANEALLSKLLAIVDDFDRAIANMPPELAGVGWVDGIAAIDRKLRLLLDSEGLTPIEAVGHPFDPHKHEAVTQDETTDVPEGTVTQELQRGYRVRDRVLRPAMVAVAKHPDNNTQSHNETGRQTAGDGGHRAPDGASGGIN